MTEINVETAAIALFEGDAAAAREWLNSPCRALGGKVPAELITSGTGVQEVLNLITRLEHGVIT
ncbi:MAG: antitoxin Xre/MbcA/ParS toxin-binding domain-containing protein [Enterobacteriaceae bacterium]